MIALGGLQVQKGKYVVMAACAASGALAFSLAGERLWLGRVEHRGHDSLKLHYYQQLAGTCIWSSNVGLASFPQWVSSGKCLSGNLGTAVHLIGLRYQGWHVQRL